MPFRPAPGTLLEIDGERLRVAEHPAAPGQPYGQEGRQATVYCLDGGGVQGLQALKVFKPRFRPAVPAEAVRQTAALSSVASLRGLSVCRRSVLTPERHRRLIAQEPDLAHAVLMPWIGGHTWLEVVQGQTPLNPAQSLALARSLAGALAAMEERSIAHCDLSGANLLLPRLLADAEPLWGTPVEFVDVEQLFLPGLPRPAALPGGSEGYAHASVAAGVWGAEADRFSAAVLLAEALGWADPQVRAGAFGESYFAPNELQRDCPRYRLLQETLARSWGDGVAALFAAAWASESLGECPTASEWARTLPTVAPDLARSTMPLHTPARPVAFTVPTAVAGEAVEAYIARESRFPARNAQSRPLDAIPRTNAAPPESGWPAGSGERSGALEYGASPAPVGGGSPPQSFSGYRSSTVAVPPMPPAYPVPAWPAAARGPSRGQLVALLALGSMLAAAVCYLLLIGFQDVTGQWRVALRDTGPVGYQTSGALLLAVLLGAMQAVIFRSRLSHGGVWLFWLWVLLGGLAGGICGGALVAGGALDQAGAGWLIGGIAGAIGALGQLLGMRNHGAGTPWLVWNTVWSAVVWGMGWLIAAQIDGLRGTTAGSAFILLGMGLSFALFLALFREVEF